MKTINNQNLKLIINKGQSGRFFVGDLGYTQSDIEVWRNNYVSKMFLGTKTGNEGILTVDGYNFFVANTGGDGLFPVIGDTEDVLPTRESQDKYIAEYPDELEHLPVDAGCLGVIPMELVTVDEDELSSHGYIIDLGLDDDVDDLPIDFVSGEYFYFAGIQVILDITRQFEIDS